MKGRGGVSGGYSGVTAASNPWVASSYYKSSGRNLWCFVSWVRGRSYQKGSLWVLNSGISSLSCIDIYLVQVNVGWVKCYVNHIFRRPPFQQVWWNHPNTMKNIKISNLLFNFLWFRVIILLSTSVLNIRVCLFFTVM